MYAVSGWKAVRKSPYVSVHRCRIGDGRHAEVNLRNEALELGEPKCLAEGSNTYLSGYIWCIQPKLRRTPEPELPTCN